MCNLKYNTNDCIYETDSRNRPVVAEGKREQGRERVGVWD